MIRSAVLSATLTLASLAGTLSAGSTPADPVIAGRASVIDGDTIEIHGQRIRLHGIDAPESSQLCHVGSTAIRCGQQAALWLDSFLEGRSLRCAVLDTDRYGRSVARCILGADTDIGATMVLNGLAVAYRRYSMDYVSEEDQARAAGAGIWGTDFTMPWDWRRR